MHQFNDDDNAEAVVVLSENVVGFIIEHLIGGAKVRYETDGILFEEYLTDEDYIPLETWEQD